MSLEHPQERLKERVAKCQELRRKRFAKHFFCDLCGRRCSTNIGPSLLDGIHIPPPPPAEKITKIIRQTFFSGNHRFPITDFSGNCPKFRERKSNPNVFFSNFSGNSGISRQNPGISRQKSLISLVSRGIPNFLAPTPSRGRPLPHRKIFGLKSLGLCSFFVPENYAPQN